MFTSRPLRYLFGSSSIAISVLERTQVFVSKGREYLATRDIFYLFLDIFILPQF